MKTILWAALQSLDVLEQVDRMLPNLIDEDDLEYMPGRYRYRRGLKKVGRAYDRSTTYAAGLALVIVGIMMLIPGPVDILFGLTGSAIGSVVGGPGGAALGFAIGVAVYNIMAIAVIVVGLILIASSFLGL